MSQTYKFVSRTPVFSIRIVNFRRVLGRFKNVLQKAVSCVACATVNIDKHVSILVDVATPAHSLLLHSEASIASKIFNVMSITAAKPMLNICGEQADHLLSSRTTYARIVARLSKIDQACVQRDLFLPF